MRADQSAVIETDVHSLTCIQATTAIDALLRRAGSGVYRIRIIHGYRGGTALRDEIRRRYRSHPKVRRIELSGNPGETVLVLREY